ncbi:YgjV family protein [Marinomonas posidonica]|nr:YgjV family protein [Marinomonas posidonica]
MIEKSGHQYFIYFQGRHHLDNFVLSQCLLIFTIFFDLISFQFKKRKIIVFCFFLAAAFNATHFYLLEQPTAAWLMFMGSVRYFVSIFFPSRKVAIPFLIIPIAVLFLTFTGIASILACLGSMIKTSAVFCKHDKKLRQFMMVGTVFWIINNAIVHSPLGVLMEVLFLTSNLIAYYRYYINRTL